MSFPLVQLTDVTKTYSLSGQAFYALKNIYFELHRGEMTAIVGASGSGKSTLMNIIGLLDQKTGGQYFFDGQDVSSLPEHALSVMRNQKIGFVFQSFFLLPRLTALQNVMLPLFYRGTSSDLAKQKAIHMLEKVGLSQVSTHKPNQLSGGQQQRVAIARALINDPQVILADEPTGALDSKTGQEVMALLIHLNRYEGRTIMIITHDQAISGQCQRMVIMKDGCIEC